MLQQDLRRMGLPSLLLAAACSGDMAILPPLPPCTASHGQAINLAVGEYASVDPIPDSGCVVFSGNSSATNPVEYLLVAQSASGTPGVKASFMLRGDTIVLGAAAAASVLAPPSVSPPPGLTVGQRFHDFLRGAEARRSYVAPPAGAPPAPALSPGPAGVPPDSGSSRLFSVCSKLDCTTFAKVTATALVVRGHIALYVDNAAPSPGLTQTDLDSIASMFNSRLYAIDTTAFGRESDIDNNQVVDVLMTSAVNKLVTASTCQTSGFVAGFFFGADLDPATANNSNYNHGEVFYTLVADPNGSLSCPHSASDIRQLVPVTFIHEFQHMISFNQHVLRGQPAEVLWLNEGMSHLAEELGGRSFGTSGPQFSTFVIGDVVNAYQYLDAPGDHFLAATEGIGTLAERGAMWLFVRYIVDQFKTPADTSLAATAAVTRKLEQTSLTGAANVTAQTGVSFDTLAARWALANFVSDLDTVPGFTPPAALKYTSWRFRTTYASLHNQAPSRFPKVFPLVPTVSAGTAVSVAGTIRAGSGAYHRALQVPSAPGFTLLFGAPEAFVHLPGIAPLPPSVLARLEIIRIR